MFSPPRFVVVDDEKKHLDAIAEALQILGSVCARMHYKIEEDLPAGPFKAVRAIFMDLQLQDRTHTSDFRKHYAEIQRILELVINPVGGPYLLVLWTDRPEAADDLIAYLDKGLEESPNVKPFGILPLSKTDYIDTASGDLLGPDAGEALRAEIVAHLGRNPAAAALVQWEGAVLEASARVLAELFALSAEAGGGGEDLALLLKRLTCETVGRANVGTNPRAEISSALLPLLQDRLQNLDSVGDTDSVWSDVLAGARDAGTANRDVVLQLNSMLHVDAANSVRPVDWGSVCELEENVDWQEFGYDSEADCLAAVAAPVRVTLAKYPGAKLVQVRVGAACDYAQRTDGPIPFALAAAIPEKTPSGVHALNGGGAWISPLIEMGDLGPVQLAVQPRFIRVRGAKQVEDLHVLGRLKEQLLLELISGISAHGARPGIVRLQVGD